MNRLCFRILSANSSFLQNHMNASKHFQHSFKNLFLRQNAVVKSLEKLKFGAALKLNSLLNSRRMCTSPGDNGGPKRSRKPALLMVFEPIMRPEVLLSIKNWIMAKFIIQPYLDQDFTLKDFTNGSKQALAVVSSLLSEGDFQSLKGLVAEEALTEIKSNYSVLNVKERQDLLVKIADILFAFPYQIGIIFDDDNQKRFAEITVVYHCLSGFEELRREGKVITEEAKEDLKICNYRFIREYTKGVESDWIINKLGHFKICHFED
ncbi:m-AAA protease-interacting protein 1, mitochondrial-like [Uloborus diversus]|uniref:m-AAA protease-interacting protein 1, mitochondrial-like n=1 Tax=Uloborus diversus TaxID=327109 RepID=UPI00240A808F|nr:m-AAA protease-interacting protein 1, mitochondrial-like [Uloborus diversus]